MNFSDGVFLRLLTLLSGSSAEQVTLNHNRTAQKRPRDRKRYRSKEWIWFCRLVRWLSEVSSSGASVETRDFGSENVLMSADIDSLNIFFFR